jgi:hypothetical protein
VAGGIVVEKVKKLYHGTNTNFDKFDLNKSGGLVNFAENKGIADMYAKDLGSGGRKRLKNDEIVIINTDTDEKFNFDPEKRLWVNDKGLGFTRGEFQEMMDEGEGYFDALPKNPKIIEVTSPTSKILDTYPDMGQAYHNRANKKGLEAFLDVVDPSKIENTVNPQFTNISQRYIERLRNQAQQEMKNTPGSPGFGHTFWGLSKMSKGDEINEAIKGMKGQLQNAGYEGLRFQDEYYPTTALFNPTINTSAPLNTKEKYLKRISNFVGNSKLGKLGAAVAPYIGPMGVALTAGAILASPNPAEAAIMEGMSNVVPGGVEDTGISDERAIPDPRYQEYIRRMSQKGAR